jgi:hypothetical protein
VTNDEFCIEKTMIPNASRRVLFLFVFLLPLNAKTPRIICALGPAADSYDAYADQRPTPDAMELARRVSAALVSVCSPNCASLVLFRNSTIPGAILVADPGGAKMVYSPQFFTSVYEKYGDGAIIAIIAHMLGHAIDATAPARWMNNSWPPELRADAWTGCALANADLSQAGLGAALKTSSTYPPPSRPKWDLRVAALRLGYTRCGGEGAKFDKAANGIH